MSDSFKIRAHHGMCLHFFIGEGYSSSFVENMWKKKSYLETENPIVEIIDRTDQICKECPNNVSGNCTSYQKVKYYDNKVIKECGMESNQKMTWSEFYHLVEDKILKENKRESICGDCQWNDICKEVEKKRL